MLPLNYSSPEAFHNETIEAALSCGPSKMSIAANSAQQYDVHADESSQFSHCKPTVHVYERVAET